MNSYQPAIPRAALAACAVMLSAATLVATVVLPEKSASVATAERAVPIAQAPAPLGPQALIEPYRIEVYGVRERASGYTTASQRVPASKAPKKRNGDYHTVAEPARGETPCREQSS